MRFELRRVRRHSLHCTGALQAIRTSPRPADTQTDEWTSERQCNERLHRASSCGERISSSGSKVRCERASRLRDGQKQQQAVAQCSAIAAADAIVIENCAVDALRASSMQSRAFARLFGNRTTSKRLTFHLCVVLKTPNQTAGH